MRLIKKETTVRVPRIHAFDATVNNEVGCPFILMECVDAKPLGEFWYGDTIPREEREDFRAQILKDIAKAMVQLTTLTFDQGGVLQFGPDGNIVGVGPSWILDYPTDYKQSRQSGDKSAAIPFCRREPMSDPQAFMLFLADRSKEMSELSEHDQGLDQLLRIMINWLFEQKGQREPGHKFVLSHPDLDTQNILISPDGRLTFIDWDGVVAVPRSVGCLKYPLWLMANWDALNYWYDNETCKWKHGEYEESSPKKLVRYRVMYANSMENALRKAGASGSSVTEEDAALTRGSLVAWALENAAKSVENMQGVLYHMFGEIEQATEGWDDNTVDAFLASRQSHEKENGNGGPAISTEFETSKTAAPAGRPVRPMRGARRPKQPKPALEAATSSRPKSALTEGSIVAVPNRCNQSETLVLESTPSIEAGAVSAKRSYQATPARQTLHEKPSPNITPSMDSEVERTDEVCQHPPSQHLPCESSDSTFPMRVKPSPTKHSIRSLLKHDGLSPKFVPEAKNSIEVKPGWSKQSVTPSQSSPAVKQTPKTKPSVETESAPKRRPCPPLAHNHIPSRKLVSVTESSTDSSSTAQKPIVHETYSPSSTKPGPRSVTSTNKCPGKEWGVCHPLLSPCSRPGTLGPVLEPLADLMPAQINSFKPLAPREVSIGENRPVPLSTTNDRIAKMAIPDKGTQGMASASTTVTRKCGVARVLSWTRKKMRRARKTLVGGSLAVDDNKNQVDTGSRFQEEEACHKTHNLGIAQGFCLASANTLRSMSRMLHTTKSRKIDHKVVSQNRTNDPTSLNQAPDLHRGTVRTQELVNDPPRPQASEDTSIEYGYPNTIDGHHMSTNKVLDAEILGANVAKRTAAANFAEILAVRHPRARMTPDAPPASETARLHAVWQSIAYEVLVSGISIDQVSLCQEDIATLIKDALEAVRNAEQPIISHPCGTVSLRKVGLHGLNNDNVDYGDDSSNLANSSGVVVSPANDEASPTDCSPHGIGQLDEQASENICPDSTVCKNQPANTDAVPSSPIEAENNGLKVTPNVEDGAVAAGAVLHDGKQGHHTAATASSPIEATASKVDEQAPESYDSATSEEVSVHIDKDAFTPIVNDDGKVYAVKMPCECEPEKTSAHLRHISLSSSGNTTGSTETLASFPSSTKSAPSSFTRVSTKGHPLQCYGQIWGGPKIWEVDEVEKLMAKCRQCQKWWCKKKEQKVVEGGVKAEVQGYEKPKGKGREAENGIKKASAASLKKDDARGAAKHNRGQVRNENGKNGEEKAAKTNASSCLNQESTGQGSDLPRNASNIFEKKAFTPLLNDEAKKVGGRIRKNQHAMGEMIREKKMNEGLRLKVEGAQVAELEKEKPGIGTANKPSLGEGKEQEYTKRPSRDAGDDNGNVGEDEKIIEKAAEDRYVERGDFVLEQVATALYKGPLDEKRMRRLKAGFLKLLKGA